MNTILNFKHLKHKRTKIIATIGPASAPLDVVRKLVDEGVNVFRLNMSHGEHETHQHSYQIIRQVAQEKNKFIAVLADLCGPKIRVGKFKDGHIVLREGQNVVITTDEAVGSDGFIVSQYKGLVQDVEVEQRIFLADGEMELLVQNKRKNAVECVVVHGGILGEHKGINLPDSNVSAPSMTAKDYKDAEFAVGLGVGFLALSFVRNAEDIHQIKSMVESTAKPVFDCGKIERPDAIVQAADVVMLARGNLGVELPPEQVPIAQ